MKTYSTHLVLGALLTSWLGLIGATVSSLGDLGPTLTNQTRLILPEIVVYAPALSAYEAACPSPETRTAAAPADPRAPCPN